MKNMQKWGIVVAVIVAVVVVFAMKQKSKQPEAIVLSASEAPPSEGTSAVADQPATAEKPLPQLIDLGAKKCVPCKMMAPILEDLAANYADRFTTIFYDVWENRTPAQQYGVRTIPTQIFLDPDGKELFRHEGYISKEDILKKWEELGYGMTDGGAA
ncbi:MAG: thioredoxin [Spartobacteria bacterium]|nr:thioredoxin [Spartobacteria bacterium]